MKIEVHWTTPLVCVEMLFRILIAGVAFNYFSELETYTPEVGTVLYIAGLIYIVRPLLQVIGIKKNKG